MLTIAKQVPQKSIFKEAENYKKWLDRIEFTATVFSIVNTIVCYWLQYPNLIQIIISGIILLFTTGIFYLQRRFEAIYRQAEEIRRDGLIDNSFNTTLANIESQEYYDTEYVDSGIKKLLASIHENSFYSEQIVAYMFKRTEQKIIFVFILLIIMAIISSVTSQVFSAILQSFLSINYLGSYLKLRDLKLKLEQIQHNCKSIASNIKTLKTKTIPKKQQAIIIREVIHYETALAYTSTMLDSKFYNKINAKATGEWKEMQNRYY